MDHYDNNGVGIEIYCDNLVNGEKLEVRAFKGYNSTGSDDENDDDKNIDPHLVGKYYTF